MNEGTAAIVFAAIVFGMVGAALNVGAKRVAWLLFGFWLGRRKGQRVKRQENWGRR